MFKLVGDSIRAAFLLEFVPSWLSCLNIPVPTIHKLWSDLQDPDSNAQKPWSSLYNSVPITQYLWCSLYDSTPIFPVYMHNPITHVPVLLSLLHYPNTTSIITITSITSFTWFPRTCPNCSIPLVQSLRFAAMLLHDPCPISQSLSDYPTFIVSSPKIIIYSWVAMIYYGPIPKIYTLRPTFPITMPPNFQWSHPT